MSESKGLRTAYSIVNLLESIQRGEIENRLQALKGLKDDIFSTADGPMPKNTARVLLQIMKELVRAKGDDVRQLHLAHDFRMAAFGKPRIIRKLLCHYHLLEMPEEWNQITFDDHVHDANTLGRKSPTHLIMDAWIKGIRRLRVIYYHYIEPRFALELIEAARIMEIDLRIGIEFWAGYRGRTISLIWVSRGLVDAEAFLCFLAEPDVVQFMEQGKAILKFQEKSVLHLLNDFNERHLDEMCRKFDINMKRLCPKDFLGFTSPGQPSIQHLGEYILFEAVKAMQLRIKDLNPVFSMADSKEQEKIKNLVEKMDCFSASDIISRYICPSQHPDFLGPFGTCNDTQVPDRLKLSLKEFFGKIERLRHSFRITLNIGNLKSEDVLEILYEGNGLITRLEIINLKDFIAGKTDHILSVNELQEAINAASLLKLKRVVRKIIQGVEKAGYVDKDDRMEKLVDILHDIDALKNMYAVRPLKSRIGSDSSGRPHQEYGMGFAIINTLPFRAKREIKKHIGDRLVLPARIKVNKRMTFIPANSMSPFSKLLPGLDQIISVQKKEWVFESFSLDMKQKGNIVALGGILKENKNGLGLDLPDTPKITAKKSWNNLNTKVKNCVKVLIGFIP
ncbi:MAG: hypothetical protein K8S18_06710, partial [Desulfobacula sp.]|nr:hypothetical protein [Desulfobacula sp.]